MTRNERETRTREVVRRNLSKGPAYLISTCCDRAATHKTGRDRRISDNSSVNEETLWVTGESLREEGRNGAHMSSKKSW